MGSLRTSPPPPRATELQRWALGSGAELRGLRASLHEALTGHALRAGEQLDDIPERVVLVATELATNALQHGLPPTTVRLLCADDVFILDVADHDLSTVPELADTRPLGAGGRGLQLARAFSLDVGWYATSHAKHIWASFPREATHDG
ncbi:ATP-binding protein [Micromonospora olivasterospora]|uniref:Anti-sigma regulatory factor (Ser/Thr protein kinase) n=1 Tax=Micromonospora olivasterospora TaxID=1880 RepID=A0A562IAR5_MICOL|nr:ATP-binding protein [Micromonospora olivasterospora]TWH68099.1 anti-sigma regulatory factor (Ser/Thr protein kinase) [Micromonospora olivasterospora]